jgi:alpha-2-macroglobulin
LIGTDSAQQKLITKNIQSTIQKLQLYQTTTGGFGYWQGENNVSEYGTNYAGHFLIEAQKNGFTVPPSMMNKWMQYQKNEARNWEQNTENSFVPYYTQSNEMLQAYRLYTLALHNSFELGAMNKMYETKISSNAANAFLAMSYALNGKTEIAKLIAPKLLLHTAEYQELSYGYGSATRDNAIVLQCLVMINDIRKEKLVAETIAKLNNNNIYNTQEVAYSLIAIANYYGVQKTNENINTSIIVNNKKQNINVKKQSIVLSFSAKELCNKNNIEIINNNANPIYVSTTLQYYPTVIDTLNTAKNVAMSVVYKNSKGEKIWPNSMQQGQDFTAEITVINTSTNLFLKEMALHYLTPSGWEITSNASNNSNSKARYTNYRDNAVCFYYDLQPNASKTFKVNLNTTYKGKFVLPNVYTEAMYDANIFAKIGGGNVVVGS